MFSLRIPTPALYGSAPGLGLVSLLLRLPQTTRGEFCPFVHLSFCESTVIIGWHHRAPPGPRFGARNTPQREASNTKMKLSGQLSTRIRYFQRYLHGTDTLPVVERSEF